MDLEITHQDPAVLKPHANNARTHSEKQINQIQASIVEFGFVNPVLVDAENIIIAGHGRVIAAKRLGLQSIPTCRIDHMSEKQKIAYRIADNKLAELAGWDDDLLRIELQNIIELDASYDLEIIGFEAPEIDIILHPPAEPQEAETVEPPEAGPAVTRLGDLWLLGPHKLYCGNSLDHASFAVLMGAEKADLGATDPPYNVPISGHVGGLGAIQHREFAMASGEMTSEEFIAFLVAFLGLQKQFSQPGSLHYSPLKFTKTLTKPHSLIYRLLEQDKERIKKMSAAEKYGSKSIDHYLHKADPPLFNNRFERRRLNILNALFIVLEACNMRPVLDDKEARGPCIIVGDQPVFIELGRAKDPRQVSVDSLALALQSRPLSKLPSWQDKDGQKLEDFLPQIATEIIVAGEEAMRQNIINNHEHRVKMRQLRLQRIANEKRDAEEKRRADEARAEQEKIDSLLSQARAFQQANEIRAFVEAVRASSHEVSAQLFEDWAQWALTQTERLDPVKTGSFLRAKDDLEIATQI